MQSQTVYKNESDKWAYFCVNHQVVRIYIIVMGHSDYSQPNVSG